jgi:hypothetical protein
MAEITVRRGESVHRRTARKFESRGRKIGLERKKAKENLGEKT